MPKPKSPSRAEAIRQTFMHAQAPLTFQELLDAASAVFPMDAKQLTGGLESLCTNDYVMRRLLQQTSDGRYGWLPHLVIGARLQLVLARDALKNHQLLIPAELATALYPERTYHEQVAPCECFLPDGTRGIWNMEPTMQSSWIPALSTRADKTFWAWLETGRAQPDDALVFQIQSALPPRCAVSLVPQRERDTACEQERSALLTESIYTFLKPKHNGMRSGEIAARLLALGLYHHPCVPNSLDHILDQDPRFRLDRDDWKVATRADRQYLALGLRYDDMFDPWGKEQKRPKHKHLPKRELALHIFRFLASLRHNKGLWREIEIGGDQALWEFDEIMRTAFGHDHSDHLSEFYLGTNQEAHHRGMGTHNPFEGGNGDDWRVGELGLEPGDTLSYTYDFGDNIQHVLKLQAIGVREKGVEYPRIVGQNKPRYRYCRDCKAEGKQAIATWVCIDCSNDEGREVLVCNEHMNEHESHYTEEMLY